MKNFLQHHQLIIGAIAASTGVSASILSYLEIATPIFAFLSAFFGAAVGLLTLCHYIRKHL